MTTSREEWAADQERVARHLIERVRQRFSGDTLRRIVGREPNEIVVLGVLDPRDPVPAEPPHHPDLPDEPGVPIDVLPPSELGVTVWVDAPDDAPGIDFEVDVSFALYVPEYPTWAEQRLWMTGRNVDEEAVADGGAAEATDDDDLAVGDDDLVDGAAASARASDAPGDDKNGNAGAGSGGAGYDAGRRSVRLAPVYSRQDVSVTFSLRVPLSGMVTEIAATQTAVDGALAAAGPRVAYELRGRSKVALPRSVIEAGADAYEAALADRRTTAPPPLPIVQFLGAATPDPRGGWRVNLTLANAVESESRRAKPAQTIYDARFSARLAAGTYKNFGYRLSERDWRTDPQVFAHGRYCVSDVDESHTVVSTNTWPVYRDLVFESRADLQPEFQELIDNPIGTLGRIDEAMGEFARQWESYLDTAALAESQRASAQGDLLNFQDEALRFHRGVDLLGQDRRLLESFVDANRAFLLLNTPNGLHPDPAVARGEPTIKSWRLFQIVFIVLGLSALAAREHSAPELQAQLQIADVLWFPTGGGKSEAFLGLVAVALFYDRRRGKAFGTTALIRFPLRMLSVQQLDRVLRLLTACEAVRVELDVAGERFELGYLVGRANTPNTLCRQADDRWGDIRRMAQWGKEERRKHVVVPTCPYCRSTNVELVADPETVRLDHRCLGCGTRIPVVISDDEVFRTLPAVVVATVDKLAAIAFQPHFSHLTHGPAFSCPDHGYVTFAIGPSSSQRCLARQFCTRSLDDWQPVEPYDPAPALLIQDELHLLAEDLGTLAAHYETLFAHLCRAGSQRAPKVIAATATISDYENQVRQLYALQPRRFPTEGYREGETFYAQRLPLPRRLFVGALPSRIDTAQFGIVAAEAWRENLDGLRALPADEVVAQLGLVHFTTPDQVADLLYRYELQLFYANRKNDAERVHEQMRRRGSSGPSFFEAELLTGDTPLAEISATIRRVENETLAGNPDPATRLGAVAGTSLISHGVDLARLNVLHVAGMPSTNAYYMQATARAGRTDVGVIFSAYSRSFARDRAAFHFFEPQHRYGNQLVEAVSLNRFAVNSPKKTATGMLSALIINRVARNPKLNPPNGRQIANFLFREDFQSWYSSQPQQIEDDLLSEVEVAYATFAPVLDRVVAGYFANKVKHLLRQEMANLRAGSALTIQRCFLNKPPSSFRDIDEAVEFGTFGRYSRQDFQTLTNRSDRAVRDESEMPVAVEEEELG